MGNTFAYLALLFWPLFTVYLFKRKSIKLATLWAIVGGYMFLPVRTNIDFPMIPAMDKNTIPVIAVLISCLLIKNQPISYFKNTGNLKYLVILYILVPFLTSILNTNSIYVGGHYLHGLSFYDGISNMLKNFLLITPLFVSRQIFKTYDDQVIMLKFLVFAGLIYSLLMLFEVRMSPQLHTWIYGFFPHSFVQQYRFGGFRPVVFMGHGLLVSFFTVIVVISALALWKNKIKPGRFSPVLLNSYLFFILIICKSMASIVYGVIAFILIVFVKPKTIQLAALVLVFLAVFYPTMSILKIFPHQQIINFTASIDKDRAGSLKFRFDNENLLLNHARKKFFFGWGGWGRNRVFNDETGKDESVTDGRWIITFGQYGMLGFIAEFGILGFTVIRASKALKLVETKEEQFLLAIHSLIVGLIMIDQLPNASLAPWLWLLAGILLGRSEYILQQSKLKKRLLK